MKAFDFEFGIQEIIPSTKEAFHGDSFDGKIRKEESAATKAFKEALIPNLAEKLKSNKLFPTDKGVFIFILQQFAGEKEYSIRDVDNMAKTMLDVLKGRFYNDDKQVRSLLVAKRMDNRIPGNFAYCGVMILKDRQDVEPIKICNIENAVKMYGDAVKQARATL